MPSGRIDSRDERNIFRPTPFIPFIPSISLLSLFSSVEEAGLASPRCVVLGQRKKRRNYGSLALEAMDRRGRTTHRAEPFPRVLDGRTFRGIQVFVRRARSLGSTRSLSLSHSFVARTRAPRREEVPSMRYPLQGGFRRRESRLQRRSAFASRSRSYTHSSDNPRLSMKTRFLRPSSEIYPVAILY